MESITLSCYVLYLFRFILAAVTTLLVVMAVLFFKNFIIFVLPVFFYAYFFYIPRFVKGYKIIVEGGRLHILRGVFIKSESIFEHTQFLYLRTVKTPLCSLFGCKYLLLFAPRVRCLIVLDNASAEKFLGDIYEKT